MPTQLKRRNNEWVARVVINGREVDSKVFPPGRKKGPEWTAAKVWEVQRKKEILAAMEQQETPRPILTGFERLLEWSEKYLDHAMRTMSHITYTEKKTVMAEFLLYCRDEGIDSFEGITKPMAAQFLADVADERSLNRSNVYRKNLLAAMNWGKDNIKGFPQGMQVFEQIRPYTVDTAERYVPPEEDVIKVLQQARGQDLIMLLTYYYTGARRGEVFRLSLSRDLRFDEGLIRLTDHKGKGGKKRTRWAGMHPELAKALRWWVSVRPCQVDNVFMQIQNDTCMGLPFRQRNHLMPRLCRRAGVKPFGFHSMRHKSAAITFVGGGLNAVQILMGHSRATTTDLYIRSAGLYTPPTVILDALGATRIAAAADELLKEIMPPEAESQEAFCVHPNVYTAIQ